MRYPHILVQGELVAQLMSWLCEVCEKDGGFGVKCNPLNTCEGCHLGRE